MKTFFNFVVFSVLAIVAVMGLTLSSADAQPFGDLTNLNGATCQVANPLLVAIESKTAISASGEGCAQVVCEGDRQYYPNPDECESFCQCSKGVPVYQPCPEGLEFNSTLNVCDWPEDAGCSVDSKSSPF